MNDTDWAERLEALAEGEDANVFDIRDDIARGRSRLRHNRVGVTGAAALVGVVVLGTGLALGAAGSGRGPPPLPSAKDRPPLRRTTSRRRS